MDTVRLPGLYDSEGGAIHYAPTGDAIAIDTLSKESAGGIYVAALRRPNVSESNLSFIYISPDEKRCYIDEYKMLARYPAEEIALSDIDRLPWARVEYTGEFTDDILAAIAGAGVKLEMEVEDVMEMALIESDDPYAPGHRFITIDHLCVGTTDAPDAHAAFSADIADRFNVGRTEMHRAVVAALYP